MSRKPHLIYLMADHLRADVIGPYPSDYAKCPTPNIDALAESSTVFINHFTPCPLCAPARSSIMTGRWTHHHGGMTNQGDTARLAAGTQLLPGHLAQQGYEVVHFGVQHVKSSPDFRSPPGVDFPPSPKTGLGKTPLNPDDFRSPCVEMVNGTPEFKQFSNAQTARWPLDPSEFFDLELTDRIIDYLDEHDPDQPLTLFGMYWAPHPPLVVPDPWYGRFAPDNIQLPPTVGRWCEGQSPIYMSQLPGQIGGGVPREYWPVAWSAYLGLVAMLDECWGRVINKLKEKGMFADSLIVVTSDHGEMLGCHSLYQKMCMYEEAVRVPFVAKFPGQVKGRTVDELTNHVDIAPTFCSVAGGEAMSHLDGEAVEETGPRRSREFTFSEYHGNRGMGESHWMVRSKTHKVIDTGEYGLEMYDLLSDPFEERSIVDEVSGPVGRSLVAALESFRSSHID